MIYRILMNKNIKNISVVSLTISLGLIIILLFLNFLPVKTSLQDISSQSKRTKDQSDTVLLKSADDKTNLSFEKPSSETESENTNTPLTISSKNTPNTTTKGSVVENNERRGGYRIGGQARLMDSLVGIVDIDDIDIAKTINVHILQNEKWRYYFDLDSKTVPAGEKVRFVIHNTHFTPDECW